MSESSRRDKDRSPSDRRKDKHRHRDEEYAPKHKHHSRHSDVEEDGHRSKHKYRDETEEERRERKRLKRDKERHKEDKRSKGHDERNGKAKEHGVDVVDDDDDLGMWIEKGVDAEDAISNIPTSESLNLKSHISSSTSAPSPPKTHTGSAAQERDSWMLEPDSMAIPSSSRPKSDNPHSATISTNFEDHQDRSSRQSQSEEADFFSSFGTEHKRLTKDEKDANKPAADYRELNTQLKEGKKLDDYETPDKKKIQFGGPGWQFRMRKLSRLHEQAEEQGKAVEDLALERYGNLEEFTEALEERRFLDDRDSRRSSNRHSGNPGHMGRNESYENPSTPSSSTGIRTPGGIADGRKYVFTHSKSDQSRPGSRAGFLRPGESPSGTPGPSGSGFTGTGGGAGGRIDQLKRRESAIKGAESSTPKASTPIPSVFTPQSLIRQTSYPFDHQPSTSTLTDSTASKPVLSIAQLNKLQAAVLRAKLSDDPNAHEMEEEYEYERLRFETNGQGGDDGNGMWGGHSNGGQMGREQVVNENGVTVETQVLPTLDGRGKLYDVGLGNEDDAAALRPGNKRKKEQKFETRDKQGNLLRYNADDDDQTLGELVRQEKFGAGAAEQKSLDAAMANAIVTDGKYQDDLDYMDENAERLARRKMKSDAIKRQFAINDFARTKKALDNCPFCYQEDRNPLTAIVALGTRTYLCCTLTEELVSGHCYIAPIQHHLSSLELEDDDWEEIRNFMKCLMKMYAKENKGVLFYETIPSFKQQRHTYIEAVPIPFEQFQDCPAYFRESILAAGSEWTQHKKLIDFSTRTGGFRRMLVPNIPYFMVQWDYKGEKGYGHIIEGDDENSGRGMNEDGEGGVYEGDKGGSGGGFPPYFAAEIIGNLLGLAARKWLKPKRMDYALNKDRARELGVKFQPYNWTVGLQG